MWGHNPRERPGRPDKDRQADHKKGLHRDHKHPDQPDSPLLLHSSGQNPQMETAKVSKLRGIMSGGDRPQYGKNIEADGTRRGQGVQTLPHRLLEACSLRGETQEWTDILCRTSQHTIHKPNTSAGEVLPPCTETTDSTQAEE